jgi:cell division cycle 2-like
MIKEIKYFFFRMTSITKSTSNTEELQSSRPAIALPINYYYCAIQGCRSVDEFECLNKIEEGAYGVVFRAKDKKTSNFLFFNLY